MPMLLPVLRISSCLTMITTYTTGTDCATYIVDPLAKPTLAPSVFGESSECRYVLPEIGGLADEIPLAATEAIGREEGTPRENRRAPISVCTSSPAARGLIEEYLAAKTRAANCQQQSSPLVAPPPPPIFHVMRGNTTPTSGVRGVTVSPQLVQRSRTSLDELAYKHPILLLDVDDDENEPEDEERGQEDENKENTNVDLPLESEGSNGEAREQSNSSVYRFNDRQQSVASGRAVNKSLDDDHDVGEMNPVQESLIVPRPKVIAFHSLKSLSDDQTEGPSNSLNDDQHAQQQLLHNSNTVQRAQPRCRLVRKVNQNILKTWEQLSGRANGSSDGSIEKSCQQKPAVVTGDSKRLRDDGELVPPTAARKQCFFGQDFALFGRTDQTAASYSSSTGNLLSDGHGSECGSTDRQSCLLYCPQQQQYNLSEEVIEFKRLGLESGHTRWRYQYHGKGSQTVLGSGMKAMATQASLLSAPRTLSPLQLALPREQISTTASMQ
uniref:Protein aurora borealis n=1 Tax=Anopheles albimanus TaxID=7167 RepID=A0A182FJT0_ANOAL